MIKKAGRDAKAMAEKIREISISEFFSKNRHLLGFDNPMKSLLTTVKEAVDNSLDACEEALIMPVLTVKVDEIADGRFFVSVEDNGPGIIKTHLPNIFGKLLYGSKFHRLKQSRGQQGIGISAAVMYGQMTTGKASEVISKTKKSGPIHKILLQIDTKKNAPQIISDKILKDEHWEQKDSGTKIAITLDGSYKDNRHGIAAYIRQTALANPHASFLFIDPKGTTHEFPRLLENLPIEPKEIKPHPQGLELGVLMQFLHDAGNKTLLSFLTNEFSRVTDDLAKSICKLAGIDPYMPARKASRTEAEAIFKAIAETKFMPPPTNCLSPIGEESMLKALYWFFVMANEQREEESDEDLALEEKTKEELPIIKKEKIGQKLDEITKESKEAVLSEEEGYFVTAVTRPPAVYRGNPFQVEVGIFYGRSLPFDETVQIFRYANRVPLQYQAAACAMTKAVASAPWKSYGISQAKGALPLGPMVLMISISSVFVPYTSESKEAVAHYPEIIKELRLALMESGRRLSKFIAKRKRHFDEAKKRKVIEKYLSPIEEALIDILGSKISKESIANNLQAILEKSRAHKEVKLAERKIEVVER